MDANKILQSDILDILFEGRNKEYGAYELRKTYTRRLIIALLAMIGLFTFLYVSATIVSKLEKSADKQQFFVQDVQLEDLKKQPEEKKPEPPPPPPPPKPIEPPKVEMQKFTPPKIVEDEKVTEPPPTQEKLEEVKISVKSQEGIKDMGIVAPPSTATTVVAPPTPPAEDYDKEFKTVQIQAKFPGGEGAWRKYLERNLNNSIPVDNGAPAGRYPVVVSFLVDKDGNISEVRAENDPGYGTADEAVRVIKRGPKWEAAEQNGRKVIYRQRQQIVFQVIEE